MKSFCISLEKNKDKWGEIIDKIHKVGFDDVDIFPGVNGKEIGELSKGNPVSEKTKKIVDSLGGISNLLSPWVRYFLTKGFNRKDHSQIPSWGGVGCYLSHVLIWMKMIEDN